MELNDTLEALRISTTTSLLSIPNEILLHIFSYFDPLHLAPLSLVNRRLNLLTTPLLYCQYIADPNVICALPIATKLPPRHASFVKHLEAWGQHSSGDAAFHRCPNLTTVSWDIGTDSIDSNYFSTSRLSTEFLHTLTSLRIELTTSFRGVLHLHNAQPFRWFKDAFSTCKNLRTLRIRPTRYELPPTTEFVPFGGPVAREHELLNLIDEIFGATLEHLVFEWCPPYRETAPNFLLNSTLNSPRGFSSLRSLQLPFSSGLNMDQKQDLHSLPTRKILYHAHLISRLRPTLTIKNFQLPDDQPYEFTPLIVDLISLSPTEILEFYDWLIHMFPTWNRQFLYPEFHPRSDGPDIYAAVQALSDLRVPFGLRHYVYRRHVRTLWKPSFSHVLASVAPQSVALEMSPRPSAPPRRSAYLDRCDMDTFVEWVSAHLRFSNISKFEIIAPGVQGRGETGGTWYIGCALVGMVAERVERLGVKRLKVCLPIGGVAGLAECKGLVGLEVCGVVVEEEGLEWVLGVLAERGLREFCLRGCVLMEGGCLLVERHVLQGRRREVEVRREKGIRDLVFEKLGEQAKVKLELSFLW